MKFKLEPDNRHCPDAVLLDDLRTVAKKLGKVTWELYKKHGRFGATTIRQRFGTWNKALERAKLPRHVREISHDTILLDLKRVAKELGVQTLSYRAYRKHGYYSSSAIERNFGSWNMGVAAAGLAPVSGGGAPKISTDNLFKNMAVVWERIGKQPRISDFHLKNSLYSAAAYQKRFKSWRKALEAFVAWVNAKDSTQIGSSATSMEPLEKDRGSEPRSATPKVPVVQSAANSQKPRSKRNPSLRLRFKVMKRDLFCCRICGQTAKDGARLEVDHIEPWSQGGETVIDNLQTLCKRCNEGKSDLRMNE